MPELIAHGGMGEVYRAVDASLGRTVAVKVLAERWTSDEEFHARFLREARTAASLSGEPNVIAIYDVSETGEGVPFIVMEYAIEGTLADRLRRGAVASAQALPWLEQTARALDSAHARGVVHRDVKPANLLLTDDETVRVSDFGIARAADQDTLTAVGSVLGSVGYMAPEQARGEPTSPASDRYALACVAFELLTGRRPFERESPAAELAAHAREAPPSARQLDPSLPARLDAVFARGLAKLPEDRHPSSTAFVDDLRRALTPGTSTAATVVAAPARPAVPSSTRYTAKPRGVALLGGALGLLVAGGTLAWLLTGLGGGSESATVVLTQTVQGRESTVVVTQSEPAQTVERTVTAEGGAQTQTRRSRRARAAAASTTAASACSNPVTSRARSRCSSRRSRRCRARRRSPRRTRRTTWRSRASRLGAATASPSCSTAPSRSRATARRSIGSASRSRSVARATRAGTRRVRRRAGLDRAAGRAQTRGSARRDHAPYSLHSIEGCTLGRAFVRTCTSAHWR